MMTSKSATILIDDGELDFEVTDKDEKAQEIVVVAQNDHVLKDQKGVNAPMSAQHALYFAPR
jgi:pyruvate kinase